MTTAELKRLYPNASESTIKANERLEQAEANHSQPVAELVRSKPQHREIQTLASRPPKQDQRQARAGICRVLIVRYGRKRLDDDNLTASYKGLRDSIAQHLQIDDGDPRIKWNYEQVTIKGATGTHVLITHPTEAKY